MVDAAVTALSETLKGFLGINGDGAIADDGTK